MRKILSIDYPPYQKVLGNLNFNNGCHGYAKQFEEEELGRWDNPGVDELFILTGLIPEHAHEIKKWQGHVNVLTHSIVGNKRDIKSFFDKHHIWDEVKTKTTFITAYEAACRWFQREGCNFMYVPMKLPKNDPDMPKTLPKWENREDAVIWLGNIIPAKRKMFDKIMRHCNLRGKKLYYISHNQLCPHLCDDWTRMFVKNGDSRGMTRAEILAECAKYKYGVGVARAFLELRKLGCHTLNAGEYLGGLIIDTNDETVHKKSGWNSEVCTYSNRLDVCLDYLFSNSPLL